MVSGSGNHTTNSALILRSVVRFLTDVHARALAFREFAAGSTYIQELLGVLYSVVVQTESASPLMELRFREIEIFTENSVTLIRPLSANDDGYNSAVDHTTSEDGLPQRSRKNVPRRMSSYVVVTKNSEPKDLLSNGPPSMRPAHISEGQTVEELLELIISVFFDQIFVRKDFPGLGLFMRVPPALHDHQSYFETYMLRNTILHLRNHVGLHQKLLWEPRVLTNLARFSTHLTEAIYEGWFANGSEDTVELLAEILEYLQLPEISNIKSVRLCSQVIANLRIMLYKVALIRISDLNAATQVSKTVHFLEKLAYWQVVLQPTDEYQLEMFRMLCFLLYDKLIGPEFVVRSAAADLWRMLMVQRHDEIISILRSQSTEGTGKLAKGFEKIMELDNDTFLAWVSEHQQELTETLFQKLSRSWATFVAAENQKTLTTVRARINKRKDKLRQWNTDLIEEADVIRRHEVSTEHWRSNIFAAEELKCQRMIQDQQDAQVFNTSTWMQMKQRLRGPCGLFEDDSPNAWQLDLTEGRNRMRIRLIPDFKGQLHDYQPKRNKSQSISRSRRSTGTRDRLQAVDTPHSPVPPTIGKDTGAGLSQDGAASVSGVNTPVDDAEEIAQEKGFELVEEPREISEYEDKNRKVMRSLERGDQVEHVHNVARIIGLEAIEGLLILGKHRLYLLDGFFQRSDGEVVNSWQAPGEERDPYLQMISGRQMSHYTANPAKTDHETRSWRWEDLLSLSKRRFLFRDVAIEIFFVDGRSYLLTVSKPQLRDELYQKILAVTANITDRSVVIGEDGWRIELLQNPTDETQNLGAKFTSVFSTTTSNPVTRKWVKGEISNFHYLMLVNTMAGRTFNDLTQYPVFPWVIADYTSEELDLTDPRVYRDLSKPMGCQTPARQAEFKERYRSFAEMGDETAQPFHYGTHYSSAMIVTSYLIRLQPFVHSYLLLQGGTFDHPDRLFYSIEKAWLSASRDNMTDVRELTPEFFYLPDFLLNVNGYNFGTRQGNGGPIDFVALPPWAKGDPKIFIAKNREALESDFVRQNLHGWIDLVFGHKQRGESALEATNVFHHLSYHGAKDLDNITDPVERLATIGIIHNFGQTPHQIFPKPHPASEVHKIKARKLDTVAEDLTRLPFPLLGMMLISVGERDG